MVSESNELLSSNKKSKNKKVEQQNSSSSSSYSSSSSWNILSIIYKLLWLPFSWIFSPTTTTNINDINLKEININNVKLKPSDTNTKWEIFEHPKFGVLVQNYYGSLKKEKFELKANEIVIVLARARGWLKIKMIDKESNIAKEVVIPESHISVRQTINSRKQNPTRPLELIFDLAITKNKENEQQQQQQQQINESAESIASRKAKRLSLFTRLETKVLLTREQSFSSSIDNNNNNNNKLFEVEESVSSNIKPSSLSNDVLINNNNISNLKARPKKKGKSKGK